MRQRRVRGLFLGCAVLVVSVTLCRRAGGAAVGSPPPTRAESIAAALAVIDRQLAEHGGSWETWFEELGGYREDLAAHVKSRASRHRFTFSGAAVSLHCRAEIFGRPEGFDPYAALLHFDRELKRHGIDLIVALIPSKLSVYPDYALKFAENPYRFAGDARPVPADAADETLASPFRGNAIPETWLVCGPFPGLHLDADILASIGGGTNALPRLGTEVVFQGTTRRFERFLDEHRWRDGAATEGLPVLELTEAYGHKEDATCTLFTTVVNTGPPRLVRVAVLTQSARRYTSQPAFGTRVWLGGLEVDAETAVRLGEGVFPLIVQATKGVCKPWDRIWVGPRLMEVDAERIRRPGATSNAVRVPPDRLVSIAVRRLLYRLLRNNVEVIDLHTAFRDFRDEHDDETRLYYARDSHWMNRGAREAARLIAERLSRYAFVREALSHESPYVGLPHKRFEGPKTDTDVLLIRTPGGAPFRAARDAPVIVAGDSFQGYNQHLAAHCGAQVARLIHMPVTIFTSAGLSTEIPIRLARDRHLAKRRVVVVSFNEKVLAGTRTPWPIVDLPDAPASKREGVAALPARGTVRMISEPPDPAGPYPHYLMKLYLTGLETADGKQVGSGDGVALVLAMRDRKRLPIADVQIGDVLELTLTSWDRVAEKYERIETGVLPDVDIEVGKPYYWGVVPGQAPLTQDDLERSMEEGDRGRRPRFRGRRGGTERRYENRAEG